MTGAALDVLIGGAVVVALLLSRRHGRADARVGARLGREWSPAVALPVVTCLIYLNQVLFTPATPGSGGCRLGLDLRLAGKQADAGCLARPDIGAGQVLLHGALPAVTAAEPQ